MRRGIGSDGRRFAQTDLYNPGYVTETKPSERTFAE
jgi:hypothetical protein